MVLMLKLSQEPSFGGSGSVVRLPTRFFSIKIKPRGHLEGIGDHNTLHTIIGVLSPFSVSTNAMLLYVYPRAGMWLVMRSEDGSRRASRRCRTCRTRSVALSHLRHLMCASIFVSRVVLLHLGSGVLRVPSRDALGSSGRFPRHPNTKSRAI